MKMKSDDTEVLYKLFLEDYRDFQSTAIYQNMIISETYKDAFGRLNSAILQNDLNEVSFAVFDLEQLDKKIILKSNHEYTFLAETLFLFLVVISAFLFVLFKKYEKKRNEAKQMGVYSQFMIKGIETERGRISKEIHDSVLQDLKALSFKYELIEYSENSRNKELKDDLQFCTDECISRLRSICNNLTPSEFRKVDQNENGLVLAVQNLVHEYEDRTKSTCILKIQDNLDIELLDLEKTINVFRIIQEALNNVEKHAEADKTSIVITVIENPSGCKFLKLYVTDNGKGFEADTNRNKDKFNHFGLANMKERAKVLGANIQIVSEPGQGTEIILEVPLK